MSEFGSSTGKQREYLNNVESVESNTNSIIDNDKNIWQHSVAYIQSYDGPVYTVFVEKENVKIYAILGANQTYWTQIGIPANNDKVIIRHKKDYFKATIESVIDKENNYDIALFSRVRDKDTNTDIIVGRYRDAHVNKDQNLWDKAWKALSDIYLDSISSKNQMTKTVN